MKLSRMFNSLPKRLTAGALVALAIALPVAASAADMVKIEADTTVANASVANPTWGASTSASYNQVVDVQVVYNNDEAAGSGKVANNLRIKINIPTTAGVNQTITTTTSADNSNTVNGSAKVTLDRAEAYLQYIPGTATWKHAESANAPLSVTQKVSDAVVTSQNGLVLENENPCQAGSIQVQARVMTPGVKVTKQVRNMVTGATWAKSNTAKPDETIQYQITYQNTGNTQQNQVIIRDNLPAGATLVPKTTYLVNNTNPNGILSQSDTLAQGGIYVGNYGPTANAYIIFEVKMPGADQLKCGDNTLTNVGVAQPQGMQEYYDTATTTINKVCTPPPHTPTYSCDAFHVTTGDNRTVKVDTFKFKSSDNSKLDSVVLDWGDTAKVTTNNLVGQQHQYSKDGSYTISLSKFMVNGKQVDVSGNCVQTVKFTTPGTPTPPSTPNQPAQLVNTGAGDVIGIFAGVAILGAFAHRLFLSRRLARQ